MALAGTVSERRFLGAVALYTVRLENGETLEVEAEPGVAAIGDRVGVVPRGKREEGSGKRVAGLHLFGTGPR